MKHANWFLSKKELAPNPWFTGNGLDDKPAFYTANYLSKLERRNKRFGKAAKVGSKLASKVIQVDVVGSAKYANAIATSQHHLHHLSRMSQKLNNQTHENSFGTLNEWLNVLIRMKKIQRNLSAVGLVGAAVPVDIFGTAAELAVKCGSSVTKSTQTNICRVVAADLHWRAYQEQFITENFLVKHLETQQMLAKAAKGKAMSPEEVQKILTQQSKGLKRKTSSSNRVKKGREGPACQMLYELFARRGVSELMGKTRFGDWMLGRTAVDQIIADPCGWEGLTFKLLSI